MLLRLGRTTIDLFEHLTNQILSQVSKFAGAIKKQAIEYSNMMGVPSESPLLWDLSHSTSTVLQRVSEKTRKGLIT
jgi:hypothetical protein